MTSARLARVLVGACVTASLLVGGPAPGVARPDAPAAQSDAIPGVVLVRVAAGRQAALERQAARDGYRVERRLPALGVTRLRVPAGQEQAAATHLAGTPGVVWADVSHPQRVADVIPNDTYFQNFQWNLSRIGMPAAWTATTGKPSVVVAVLDTGVDAGHPDLAGNVLPGYDFVHDDADPSDDSSHGTAVAGIIAAVGNNGAGIAGITWQTRILPVKVLDRDGQGSDDIVAQGIVYATDNGARIINISSSTTDESSILRDAVRYADSKGVLIVAAAGNTGDRANLPNFPAAYPEVLAVGATDRADKVPIFSQRQPYIGLAAPGVDIPSTAWSGAGLGPYALTTGTSAAAPHVSGVAALLLSVRPDLSNDQLRRALETSAVDVCPPDQDPASGAGRLDAAAALASIGRLAPPSGTSVPTADETPVPGLPVLPNQPSLSAAPVPQSDDNDNSSADQPASPTSWYFAEGSTQPPFETWLALFNPTQRPAAVRITYMPADGQPIEQDVRMPPDCRHSIRVNDVAPNLALSIRVDSDDQVLAERSMYFGHDGTSSVGVADPSRTWYLAEGSSAPPFDTWILLQNPDSARQATVTLSFMREDGSVVTHQEVIPPTSRRSVYVNQLFQVAGFSTAITSDIPIVAERAMYFDGAQGGTGTLAVPEPHLTWYLAEGETASGYDTWLLVQNPNRDATSVTITFYPEGGPPTTQHYQVGGQARFSLYTNTVVPPSSFGMKVEADDPVVVERAVYFAQGRGGFASVGLPDTGKEWFLPDGTTKAGYHETLALLNPNDRSAKATILLTRADGAPDISHEVDLPAAGRVTVDVNGLIDGVDVAAHVSSDRPIVVERTSIFHDGLGGTGSPGIRG